MITIRQIISFRDCSSQLSARERLEEKEGFDSELQVGSSSGIVRMEEVVEYAFSDLNCEQLSLNIKLERIPSGSRSLNRNIDPSLNLLTIMFFVI